MSTATQPVQQATPFALQPAEPKAIEFVPFGGDTKIKLSVKIVQNLVCIPTRSGKLCSERDALRFMMLCQAQALNPFAGDAFLQGYDGKNGPEFSLITAHVAFLKRAELHPEFDGMASGVVVRTEDGRTVEYEGDFYGEGDTVIGGWAKVFFKNRKVPMYKKLRLVAFRKEFGVWVNNPEGMIVKCAEADALRSSFPTKLGGLYLGEEQQQLPKQAKVEVLAPDFSNIAPAQIAAPQDPPPSDNAITDAPPVPNTTLGEKPKRPKAEPKTPAPGTREAFLIELRDLMQTDAVDEKDVLKVLYKLQMLPDGTRLESAPSDLLKDLLTQSRWSAIVAETAML